MSGVHLLNIEFKVREDLPSERILKYRQLIIDGLKQLQVHGDLSNEKHAMVNRLFWDHIEDPNLLALMDVQRIIADVLPRINRTERNDSRSVRELEAVDEIIRKALKASNVD